MKIIKRLATAAVVGALAIGLAPPAQAAPNDPVSVPDAGLQDCIAYALGGDVVPAPSYTEAQLASLEELRCTSDDFWTEVNDLAGLEKATGLTAFSVYGPELKGMSELSALPLEELDVASGQAVDLSPLAGKDSLQALKVTSYDGSGSSPAIPSFPQLTELSLYEVPLSVISTSVLPRLTSLTFYGSYDSVTDLSALPALDELTELNISHTQMSHLPALHLPKLTSLTAFAAGLTDAAGLTSLPELTTLDLRANLITALPSSGTLPKLEVADLRWNEISSISTLPAMPVLKRLDLRYNNLTKLPELNLPKLDWLGLAHNDIASISRTTNLPELNAISLVGNRVTDIGPLTSYPKLSTVFVNGNKITNLSTVGSSYRFKGQLHATNQSLTPAVATVKACTSAPLPTVTGAPDSKHSITWTLPTGTVRSGSSIVYPESAVGSNRVGFSQLGRFTRSDSKDDIYFSGRYYQNVTKPTAILAPTPTISGTVRFGTKLTVRPGSWCPVATKLSYQWLRNGSAIARATGATYTPTVADVGKKLSVRVTGTRAGLSTVAKTSTQTVVAKATLGAKTPAITGTAKKGKTLKVKMSAWTPAPVKITYQWLRNGSAISGATKSSYKLTKKDKKKYISVRATGTKAGYATASRTSAKTAKVK